MNLEIEVHNTAEVLKAKKVTTYSEQPGQFLEQLLIVPDLRLRIYYFTYTYELGQPRCCQSGRWIMPRSILHIGM